MIEFQNVTICYEKERRHPVPSLEHFNLAIGQGEWVFVVGPSGAGKSTLLKLIIGEVRADEGKVLVENDDVTTCSPVAIAAMRRKIGVVFQDFGLLEQKTAWENVAFALRVIGVPQSRIVREVPRALETVGIAHRAHAFPHELSGGEQQRVAIARAIVNDPHLLLADEPTGNLDPATGQQIGDLLERINRELGTTVIMVTHDRTLVDQMRRRVVRLRDGRLVADDERGIYHADDDVIVLPPEPVVASSPPPRPAPERNSPDLAPVREEPPVSRREADAKPSSAVFSETDAAAALDELEEFSARQELPGRRAPSPPAEATASEPQAAIKEWAGAEATHSEAAQPAPELPVAAEPTADVNLEPPAAAPSVEVAEIVDLEIVDLEIDAVVEEPAVALEPDLEAETEAALEAVVEPEAVIEPPKVRRFFAQRERPPEFSAPIEAKTEPTVSDLPIPVLQPALPLEERPSAEHRASLPGADPAMARALQHAAPIGSPDNPIVQYER